MAQFTSSETTASGLVVTAVFDTDSNSITYTVTAPNGTTATNTTPASESGNASSNVQALVGQLTAAGFSPRPFASALGTVSESVKEQATKAQKEAETEREPVAEPKPIPVEPTENPNPTPEPAGGDTTTPNEKKTIDPDTDPNTNTGGEEGGDTTTPNEKKTIDPDTDPNTNTGGEVGIDGGGVDVGGGTSGGGEVGVDGGGGGGDTGALNDTRSTATNQDAVSFEKAKDWRVRLSLAPSAKYLYKADAPGILKPLQATNGVIFPYTPTVSAVYAASYDASELIHSNYKIYNYKNSNVDTVTITGDFTAQDTNEANYLLAVIHFFKSVTKMFYGQDQNPRNGVPPPLVYMSGLGTFQFDNHPLAVTNFTYSLPNEVDYIRAGSMTNEPGSSTANQTPVNNTDNASTARIQSSGLGARTPNFQRQQATINSNATYVPTKMQIVITCIPIVTRNDISNNFSLKNYATGALLQGSKRNGGGMW
jgi:hypothetical protein